MEQKPDSQKKLPPPRLGFGLPVVLAAGDLAGVIDVKSRSSRRYAAVFEYDDLSTAATMAMYLAHYAARLKHSALALNGFDDEGAHHFASIVPELANACTDAISRFNELDDELLTATGRDRRSELTWWGILEFAHRVSECFGVKANSGFAPYSAQGMRRHQSEIVSRLRATFASIDGRRDSPYESVWAEAAAVAKSRKPEGDKPEGQEAGDQFLTLDQMAARVSRSKRTLEGYLKKGRMPPPAIKGSGGKPHEWIWSTVRPWLEQQFGRKLPIQLPVRKR